MELGTLFNVGINIYFIIKEIKNEDNEPLGFPYYFNSYSFIYKVPTRIVVSISVLLYMYYSLFLYLVYLECSSIMQLKRDN